MNDSEAIGGSFYWYERDRLRRQIASQRVLRRLPTEFGTLADHLDALK